MIIQNPILKKQHIFLKFYSFFWWASLSVVNVFQAIYFVKVGIPIHQIFFNSAIAVFVSLFIVNFWSKVSDRIQKKKIFIIAGNISRIIAFLFLPFANDVPTMLIYTFIFSSGPHSDALLISYIYKLSDYTNPEIKQTRPVYHQIRSYTEIRKFGSIGWAIMLPFGGLIINQFGFGASFFTSAVILIVITILFAIFFKEDTLKSFIDQEKDACLNPPTSQPPLPSISRNTTINSNSSINSNTTIKSNTTINSNTAIKNNVSTKESSLFRQITNILKNHMYSIFILVSFVAAIAAAMNNTIFSVFNSRFSFDNYILLGLTWSVNAFIEYPVMMIVAERIEKSGWINVLIFTYLLSTIRLMLNPLLIIFNGTIIWVYIFQIINGFNFGLGWPATTLGLHSNLEKHQKSLGITFFTTVQQAGTLTGNLIGQLLSFMLNNEDIFYISLYITAAIIYVFAALFLYLKSKKKVGRLKQEKNRNLK
jgi:MFS family permease